MKIKITYEKDSRVTHTFPFWAKTEIDGETISTCGDCWEDAKGRLLTVVKDSQARKRGEVPADEEVEI